jgi:hypothetical protein
MFPNKENPMSLLPAIPNTNQQEPMKNISIFTIPLLTKEQVLQFEPSKEPLPNYSDSYGMVENIV